MTNIANEVGESEFSDVDVEVGIRVQSLMFRHRMNQAALGAIIGVKQSTVSAKLRGKVAFSIVDLMKIGRALDVDPAELIPAMAPRVGLEPTTVRLTVGSSAN